MDKKEITGVVTRVAREDKSIQLDNVEWYGNWDVKVPCKVSDTVKVIYTDNTKDGRTFHNWTAIEVTEVGTGTPSTPTMQDNARLRRITDCVLASYNAASDDQIKNMTGDDVKAFEVTQTAIHLYEIVKYISDNN